MGGSIPKLIAAVVRLNLFGLFLIYIGNLFVEFWPLPGLWPVLVLMALSSLLFAVTAIRAFVREWGAGWQNGLPTTDLGSSWVWGAPLVLALAGTLIIGCWDPTRFQYHLPLLKETVYQAQRGWKWIP